MTDFKVDEAGDLLIQNGDLVVSDSTIQHQGDIINAEKGWWHFAPSLGVGLTRWLNESNTNLGLASVIRQELQRDGLIVERISVTQDGISVDAFYPS